MGAGGGMYEGMHACTGSHALAISPKVFGSYWLANARSASSVLASSTKSLTKIHCDCVYQIGGSLCSV